MEKAFIKVDLKVKFRAFGITFGNISEVKTVPLPAEAALVTQLLGPKQFFTYNDHGVALTLTLTDNNLGV